MRRALLGILGMVLMSSGLLAADADETVAEQKKQAEELWKSLLSGRPYIHKDTENFLVYATVSDKEVDAAVRAGDKTITQAKKVLQWGAKDMLWKGKLTLHLFAQRAEFAACMRRIEKRSPDADETSCVTSERDNWTVIVGPPSGDAKRLPIDVDVVRQVAAAVLVKKAGRMPEWFQAGFGRSFAYRHAPMVFAAERARAAALVRVGKSAKDVWTGNLGADEALVLNASFVDYLVNGPNMAKTFQALMDNYGEETPFEDALKAAKIPGDRLDYNWRNWARTVR